MEFGERAGDGEAEARALVALRELGLDLLEGLPELVQGVIGNADAVVLDMKTPGGELEATFDIMEALAKFPGITYTYVNTEAISAGAFIAATTSEIWFAPGGIIGAAAPVAAAPA